MNNQSIPVTEDINKISVGICGMDKKIYSEPMKRILEELNLYSEFQCVFIGEEYILKKEIQVSTFHTSLYTNFKKFYQQWPRTQALLTFYSAGFPFKRVYQYTQRYQPFLINDLRSQALLWDRRLVYYILRANDIPVIENFLVINRSQDPSHFLQENPYEHYSAEQIQILTNEPRQRRLSISSNSPGVDSRGNFNIQAYQSKQDDGDEGGGGGGFMSQQQEQLNRLQDSLDQTTDNNQQSKVTEPSLNKNFSSPPKKITPLKDPTSSNKLKPNLPTINSTRSIISLNNTSPSDQSTEYKTLIKSYEQDSHDDNIIYQEEEYQFQEFQDYILSNGVRLNKPFVEKPIDSQDHNIYIYYPSKSGGGHKRLFRKVNNKSSEFISGPCSVRKKGSYIYQNFLRTDGFDIKVYTVGPNYSHAQARKAPTLDGKVMRQANGKELRYPVLLTPSQKIIVRKVVETFQQTVCGFDMLRSNGKSYVCDVNGLSFVKESPKYYRDSGTMLRKIILQKFHPDLLVNMIAPQDGKGKLIVPKFLFKHRPVLGVVQEKHQELRAVVAIFRHGDRTPKQKMKMVVRHQDLLSFFKNQKDVTKQIKLKNPKKLQRLLDIVRNLLQNDDMDNEDAQSDDSFSQQVKQEANKKSSNPSLLSNQKKDYSSITIDLPDTEQDDSNKLTSEQLDRLFQMKSILQRGGHFQGINRKVQIRPLKFQPIEDAGSSSGSSSVVTSKTTQKQQSKVYGSMANLNTSQKSGQKKKLKVTQALFVVKWGGQLTKVGSQVAYELGQTFRMCMYPSQNFGLLRLHSTYRHDLKCYSSDQGRCQLTAASFLKGLLELEGDLTPILVSMVRVDLGCQKLLNTSGDPKKMGAVKKELSELLNNQIPMCEQFKKLTNLSEKELESNILKRVVELMEEVKNPKESLNQVFKLLKKVTQDFKRKLSSSNQTYSYLITDRDPVKQIITFTQGGSPLAAAQALDKKRFTRQFSQSQKDELQNLFQVKIDNSPKPQTTMTKTQSDKNKSDKNQSEKNQSDKLEPSGSMNSSLSISNIQKYPSCDNSTSSEQIGANGQTILLIYKRWQKLTKDFYNRKKQRYDISKIPDIYDCVRYDLIHNYHLVTNSSYQLLGKIMPLAKIVLPLEHGFTKQEKIDIGLDIVHDLLKKIHHDLIWWRDEEKAQALQQFFSQSLVAWQDRGLDDQYSQQMQIKSAWRHVKTRLYFTSASNLYSLMNSIIQGLSAQDIEDSLDFLKVSTLDYLSQITFRMFEVFSCSPDDDKRFRLQLAVSPGADSRKLLQIKDASIPSNEGSFFLPMRRLITLNKQLKLDEVDNFFKKMEEIFSNREKK